MIDDKEMMRCCRCDKPWKEQGGIILSPPDEEGKVLKRHVCPECYERIIIDLRKYFMKVKRKEEDDFEDIL